MNPIFCKIGISIISFHDILEMRGLGKRRGDDGNGENKKN